MHFNIPSDSEFIRFIIFVKKKYNVTKWPLWSLWRLFTHNRRQQWRQKNMGPWVAQLKIVIPDWTRIGQNAPMWNAVTWTTAEIDDYCDLILEHIYLLSVQRNTYIRELSQITYSQVLNKRSCLFLVFGVFALSACIF